MKNDHAENYIFLTSIIAVAALVALIFLPELNVIVLGITFAVLFQPLYGWLLKKMPRQRSVSALLIVLLTVLIVFAPLVYVAFQLFGEAQGLYGSLLSGRNFLAVRYTEAKLNEFLPGLNFNLNAYVQQFLGWVVNNIGPVFSGVAATLFVVLLSFFVLYYFLKDGDRLRDAVIARSPFSRDRTEQLVSKLHMVMSSIVRGTLLVAVSYGVGGGLGFFLFGLPSAALWGAMTSFVSFIPVIGVYFVIVPGMIWLAATNHLFAAIGLFIWIGAVGLLVENFLRPLLIGRHMNIHPLLVLFSVLGGISFFGPMGILLGPLALGLLIALLEMYPLLAKE